MAAPTPHAETHGAGRPGGALGLPVAIRLEIVTPSLRLVSEIVDEVVLPGSLGYLGVRPGHAPLLTSLGIGRVTYRRGGDRGELALAGGFAEVLPDRVTILADIAECAETVDRERARRARDRALKRLRGGERDTDFERAQIALQKALIRLSITGHGGPDE
jgi:F-type H+-transporting ATPase subunit epsilon